MRACLLAVALVASSVHADDSIDSLYAKRVEAKKKVDELTKELSAIDKDLRTKFEDLKKKLADAGVLDKEPLPPIPPPKPVDPLKVKLAAAFEKDGSNRNLLEKLVAVYKAGADHCKNPDVSSTKELLENIRDVAESFLKDPEAMLHVRKVVQEELRGALGKSSDDPIKPEERAAAEAVFLKLVMILESL